MLWHMAFGCVLVGRLLPLVRIFSRLPEPLSRAFAGTLQAGTRPFHHINRRLDAESETSLHREMHFPVGWDPFFHDKMTVEQVYRWATQHYDFHRAQLMLE
jgi:hypothetical protein